jgi:hypothetical protein
MKGYKVFHPNFTCNGFQYAVGQEYKHEGKFKICNSGFHFCIKASHCFSYYDFDSKNIVCEVEALGDVQTHDSDSKVATNHIRIIRQLTWNEVLEVSNEGANNTGHSNTGDRNTGNWNTGDRNTGDSNTGYSNTGDRNTGNWNTGDRNTGNWNTGYRNTGYSNTGDRNTGVFCTGEKTLRFFNKESDWTEQRFLESKVFRLLCEVDTKLWVPDHAMSEDEKASNKGWKTAGGYYRDIPYKQAFADRWNNWSEENRKAFTSLPNFDSEIFELITSVKV